MARYTVTVRQTTAREFTVQVEAESRVAALRIAKDPDEWLRADDDAPLNDHLDEVLDVNPLDAEVDDGETSG